MAKLLADTMHTKIPIRLSQLQPKYVLLGNGTTNAQNVARSANGSANIVWLNRMSPRYRLTVSNNDGEDGELATVSTTHSFLANAPMIIPVASQHPDRVALPNVA
jgi:hypothetical protein